MKEGNKLQESTVVDNVSKALHARRFSVWHEVPNLGQSADIVAMKGSKIMMIEAKTYNWQRALQQCKAHEVVADYICIAIASKQISSKLYEFANYLGYGIIHVKTTNECLCELVLPPKRNKKKWQAQRLVLESNINKLIQCSYNIG